MELGLKDTVLELKNIVFYNKQRTKMESLIDELSHRTFLDTDVLLEFYHMILKWKIQSESIKNSKKKAWTEAEEIILMFYVELQSNNTSNTQIFEEVSEVLDRTKEAVSFKYYNKTSNNRNQDEQQLGIEDIDNINESTEKSNKDLSYSETKTEDLEIVEYKPKEEFDLLSGLGQLVSNISTVGLDINPFFDGLLQMSKKAVENSNVEVVKELNEKLTKEQLDNDVLQAEFKKVYSNFVQLKKEVQYFNGLSSVEKLQQINSHSEKLNLIIERLEQSFAISIG